MRVLLRLLCLGLLWPAVASAQIGSARIVDGVAAGQADVLGSDPAGTEQGVVVRVIPSGVQHVISDSASVITLIQGGNQATINAGGRLQVEAVIETSGGTELTASAVDTDDGSIAGGQTSVNLGISLGYCFDGTNWPRCPTAAGAVTSSTPRVTEATDSQLSAGVGAVADSAATAGSTGSLTAKLRFLTTAIGVEDAAETAGTGLIMAGAVRRDTAASSAGVTGDNATLNTDDLGQLWTRTLDPCSGVAKTFIPINISTATTTELTGALAGASNHYHVCNIVIVTAAANNVALADDDSDGCGSVTSGLAGGTTAATGWNFGANGGLALGNGGSSVFRTNGTNRVLCLVTSAATQLSGTITVVAAP